MGDTTKKIVKKIKQTSEAIGDFLYGMNPDGTIGKKKKYGSQTKMGDYSKKRPQGGWKD